MPSPAKHQAHLDKRLAMVVADNFIQHSQCVVGSILAAPRPATARGVVLRLVPTYILPFGWFGGSEPPIINQAQCITPYPSSSAFIRLQKRPINQTNLEKTPNPNRHLPKFPPNDTTRSSKHNRMDRRLVQYSPKPDQMQQNDASSRGAADRQTGICSTVTRLDRRASSREPA
jgi:hypothetical protein